MDVKKTLETIQHKVSSFVIKIRKQTCYESRTIQRSVINHYGKLTVPVTVY